MQYLGEIYLKDTKDHDVVHNPEEISRNAREETTTDRRFPELVSLVVSGNAALSDVEGFSI